MAPETTTGLWLVEAGAELPDEELPDEELPEEDVPEADVPEADVPGADLPDDEAAAVDVGDRPGNSWAATPVTAAAAAAATQALQRAVERLRAMAASGWDPSIGGHGRREAWLMGRLCPPNLNAP